MKEHHNKIAQSDLEQAQAIGIVTLLNHELEAIEPKITSKLSYARQQALAHMAAPESTMTSRQGGVLRLFGGYWHQHRLLSALVIFSLLAMTFLTIHHVTNQNVIEDGDAYLLGAELPPEAYLNEGFDTWLSENSPQ